MTTLFRAQFNRGPLPFVLHLCRRYLLLLAIVVGLFAAPAAATIVYRGSATGSNTALPTDGSPGALTIVRPVVAKPGMAMIVSIAARPSRMTWTVPSGWTQLSIAAEQFDGGVSTDPGGMTLKSYYRIVGTSEPVSYTWTFANMIGASGSGGGSAVGGMLVFSGLDTSTNPIDGTPTSLLKPYDASLIHPTTAITTTVANAMVVSMIGYLSAGSFTYSGTSCGTIEALDVRAPAGTDPVGTTVQMGYFTKATAGLTCAPRATASGDADSGVGHLLALRPSTKDLSLTMTRNVPLSPGGTAAYTLTANNEGVGFEPGLPLSIVNTLPPGLTLASYSGSGWSCTPAAPTPGPVTCLNTLAAPGLAASASASPLVLNVNVSGTASGVLTNSAIVAGTGGDSNSANDTAVDTYVILPTPFAYYKLDDASGMSSLVDTSGGANATGLTATTVATGNPPSIGAALAGNPGTCGAVRIPSGTTQGISTGINLNNLNTPSASTNAGTIAFWYASSTVWNDGTARMLFDASNTAGTDKHFFLVKDGSGVLRFALEDNNDLDSTAASPSYNFAANTWHHIAVTWDLPADRLYIYLDGDTNPIATSAINVNGTLGTMLTLYLGAQRSAATGTPVGSGYTNQTANGYIDEVRIYNRALVPLEIEALADLTHACAATVDHFELWQPSNASACSPVVATVIACADSTSPCTNRQAAESGKTATLATSAGALDADATPTQTTVTFDSIGVAPGSLSYPVAVTGATATVTLSGEQLPAGQATVFNSRKCCPDGVSCVVANSCTTAFTACSSAAANFNIVDSYYTDKGYDAATDHRIYTKLAGWDETANSGAGAAGNTSFKLDVIALKSGGSTETNYVGSGGSKNVKLEIFDDSSGTACNSSAAACTACSKTVVATVNPIPFAFANAGYQNDVTVALGNTNAYSRLVTRITDANASPTVYGCSTDAFAVRPQTFAVTATTSGGAAMLGSASGAAAATTVKAGTNFTMYADTTTVGYGGTPTISPTGVSDFLGSVTVNLLNGSFGAAVSTTGKASGTTFQYGEVGYFVLATNAVADATYVNAGASDIINVDCVVGSSANSKTNGKYGCNVGSASSSWGRFVPDHFNTVVTQVASVPMPCPDSSCPTSFNGFVYSGQPFNLTVTAKNAGDVTTANYSTTTGFAKSTALSAVGVVGTATVPTGAGALGVASVTAFTDGWLTVPVENYAFSVTPTAPTNIFIRASDGEASSLRTTSPTTTSVEGGVKVVSGRIRIPNVYGSELLQLPMTATVQYYSGANWVTSTTDGVTSFNSNLSTAAGNLVATIVSGLGSGVTVASPGPSQFIGGVRTVRLNAPGAPGSVNISLNAPSYLPSSIGRATFGIYKSPLIYRRENY